MRKRSARQPKLLRTPPQIEADVAPRKLPAAPVIEEPVTGRITDTIAGEDLIFTAEEGKAPSEVEITIVRPGESANRRVYTTEAIAKAVQTGFWNGSAMFIDHGPDAMPTKRSMKDFVSVIRDTRLGKTGEAIGTARFVRPEFADFVRAAHEAAPGSFGVSIVHQFRGQRYKGTDGHYRERVEEFVRNFSVDWVAFPAAGGAVNQFLPAHEAESEEDVEWSELTADMIKRHAPAVHESIVTEARETMTTSGDEGGTGEKPPVSTGISAEDVKQIVAEAIAEDRKVQRDEQSKRDEVSTKVAETLDKSGLPEPSRKAIAKQFTAAESFDEAAVSEAINERKVELAAAGGPRVIGLGSTAPALEDVSTEIGPSRHDAQAAFEAEMGFTLSGEKIK